MTTTNGIITTDFSSSNDYGSSVTTQSDGKILVAGYSDMNVGYKFALARYNSNGSLDTSFSGNGIVTTTVKAVLFDVSSFNVSTAVANDKILIAGTSSNGINTHSALIRYNSDGSLDTSFSGDGMVMTSVGSYYDAVFSVTLQTDGKILVAGNSFNGANTDIALVRYNSNGALDNSFGSNGMVITPVGFYNDEAYSVTVQTDGKILVAGTSYNGSNYDFTLVRYLQNGSLDTSFNGSGNVTTPVNYFYDDAAYSVKVQADGRILVAGVGVTNNDVNSDFTLLRYDSSGILEGIATTAIGSGNAFAYSATIQADGKILLAGTSYNSKGNADFTLVRYKTNGVLDTSFSGDGKVVTDLGNDDIGYSVAVQTDGKILVSGTSNNGIDNDFALVRYNSDGSLDNTFNGIITNHLPIGKVIISDSSPEQNQLLTVSNTLTDADGLGIISYQWKTGTIVLGTDNTYTVSANDIGKAIKVIASYTDDLGNQETVSSATTSAVTKAVINIAGVNITGNNLVTNEQGNTVVVFGVSLKTQPLHDVSITFNSSDLSEGSLSKSKLIFTASNWATPQTLTVIGVDDSIVDNDVSYSINASITTLDVNYSGSNVNVSPIILINNNDDNIIYGDIGGSKVDVLIGNSGEDVLYGLNTNDDLSGGTGNDTLWGGYGNDVLSGNEGNDVLYGEQDNDYLDGGTGDDMLDGGLGADTMTGGAGNDTYYLGYDAADTVQDNGLATDIDICIMPYQLNTYTLPTGIENGTITAGTDPANLAGNDSNNVLTGNAGANTLTGGAGDDIVNAGAGNDEIVGGKGSGNDTCHGGTGIDTIKYTSAITGITVNLKSGQAKGDEIDNDTLDGIENVLGGRADDLLIGSNGNNVIDGFKGADTITGGLGADILIGGAGKDIFRLTNFSKDTLKDFSAVDDTIQFENSVFTKLGVGVLNSANFKIGTAAADANDYLTYNSNTGGLFYDADGNGAGAAVQIALIGNHVTLTNADFVVM